MKLTLLSILLSFLVYTSVSAQHKTSGDVEDTALQAATNKTNIIRYGNDYVLEGIYNGMVDNGCELVSVEKHFNPKMRKKWFDTYNFVICDGEIVTQKESPLEFPSIPSEIIRSVAKNAQRHGHSEAVYFDYTIKTNALRDKDMCLVQIKIIKGVSLLARWEVNACR